MPNEDNILTDETDVDEAVDNDRDEVIEDTDADTRDLIERVDEVIRKIDALADLVGRVNATGNDRHDIGMADGIVSIEDLDLD